MNFNRRRRHRRCRFMRRLGDLYVEHRIAHVRWKQYINVLHELSASVPLDTHRSVSLSVSDGPEAFGENIYI